MMFTSSELQYLADKLRECKFLGDHVYNYASIVADELETVALGIDGLIINETDKEWLEDFLPE